MNETHAEPISSNSSPLKDISSLKAVVVGGVDDFVRTKPAIAFLGAFAAGFALAHSLKKCHEPEPTDMIGRRLEDLKSVVGALTRQIQNAGEDAPDQISSVVKSLRKKASRFF